MYVSLLSSFLVLDLYENVFVWLWFHITYLYNNMSVHRTGLVDILLNIHVSKESANVLFFFIEKDLL